MNNMDNFMVSLGVMGKGMAGIFVVTTVIVLAIMVLNKFCKKS